jgi:hypothetical protein
MLYALTSSRILNKSSSTLKHLLMALALHSTSNKRDIINPYKHI